MRKEFGSRKLNGAAMVFFALLFFGLAGYAAEPESGRYMLSGNARISLLTASPGNELYSVFGHSALRVSDPDFGIDEVYNYGTFDFQTPGFYLKFIRGKLMYLLSVSTMDQFLYEYRYEGRAVYEQVLNLDWHQANAIYDFLQWNRAPGNEAYLYDFFYDNCATRIRDLVDDLLSPEWGADPYPGGRRSFRDMIRPYVSHLPWARFGTDLALGTPADSIATPWHYMFLPDEMYIAFAQAVLPNGIPLVASTQQVLESTIVKAKTNRFGPIMLMWIIFALALASFRNKRFSLIFDRAFFALMGFLGLVVLSFWLFSDHLATHRNMVMLFALPSHLVLAFMIKRHSHILVKVYFMIAAIISLMLMGFWNILPQTFHPGFFPLILTSAIKAFLIGKSVILRLK